MRAAPVFSGRSWGSECETPSGKSAMAPPAASSARQRAKLARVPPKKTLDPGGSYTLTIRGHAPAQIALESPPEEILKKSGEIGYRQKSGTFLSGS